MRESDIPLTAVSTPSGMFWEWLVFAAEEIKVLGCFVSRVGVRANPGKIKAIAAWPTPRSQKDLRKWLGLANYLHKSTRKDENVIRLAYQGDENYTPLVQFLSDGKDAKVDRLSPRQRTQLHRYELADGLLHYMVDPGDPPRVVVPNDEDLNTSRGA
ncbi:Pol protein [Phytophthora palmivora]|uniref:Pol protein n=1 Tax=Phytophthora palmivora TaxID=4796 RepID=A0A2P4XHI3_9STRA|nr:Pol protein [Phytophthora palmivora]